MQFLKSQRTPFFVLDKAKVVESVASIRQALEMHWPNSILSFSIKTNSWPALQRILIEEGVWAEVVSEFEFDLTTHCGFRSQNMICNGASKTDRYILNAIDGGSILHLDSINEVNRMLILVDRSKINFGIRINATEPDFDADPLCGPMGSRFGLSMRDGDLDRLDEILAANPQLTLTSLHLHCNTKSRGVKGFEWLARFFVRIVREHNYRNVTTLDIGGSFGHDFDSPDDHKGRWPSWNEYLKAIANTLQAEGFTPDALRLVIEPGSALISGCSDYYTRVVGDRIYNGQRVLQIDGSRLHVDPHLTRSSFAGAVSVVSNEVKAHVAYRGVAYLSGATCLEKDRMIVDNELANAAIGDVLKISKTGGYSFGLSPLLFITGAPEVLLCAGGGYSAQKRVTADAILKLLEKRKN